RADRGPGVSRLVLSRQAVAAQQRPRVRRRLLHQCGARSRPRARQARDHRAAGRSPARLPAVGATDMAAIAEVGTSAAPVTRVRPKIGPEGWIMRAGLAGLGLYLTVTIVLPLYAMLSKSFENKAGEFVGLANYVHYFSVPALSASLWNSLLIAAVSTVITILLAFVYAYALTRSCMPAKGLFRAIALVPLLAPSLLPALALVYLFGNQAVIKAF